MITRLLFPDSTIDLSCKSVGSKIAAPIEGNDSEPR